MKEKAATQEGGVTEEKDLKVEDLEEFEESQEEEVVEKELSPNDKYREQIAERRAKEVMEEMDLTEPEEDRLEATEKAEERELASDTEEEEEEEGVTVKVDGVERKVKQSDLVKSYQIDAAARKRLQEAAELKKRLDVQQATLDQRQKAVDEMVQRHDTEKKAQVEDLDFSDIVTKIREGDDEDAEKALQKLYTAATQARTPGPDVSTLVDIKLRERDRIQREQQNAEIQKNSANAAMVFKNAFKKDLEENPRFWDMAVIEDKQLENDPEWMDKPFVQRYEEAGKRARAWLNPEKAEPSSERKKTAATKPVKGRAARAKIGEDVVTPTASDLIREMAEARGQRHLS